VILVVDRTELEGQLKGWVERLLGEMQNQDIAVRRACWWPRATRARGEGVWSCGSCSSW